MQHSDCWLSFGHWSCYMRSFAMKGLGLRHDWVQQWKYTWLRVGSLNYLMIKNVRIKSPARCPWDLSAWAVTGLSGVCLCVQGEMATHNTERDLMASRCVCLKTQQTLAGRSLLKRTWTKQTALRLSGEERKRVRVNKRKVWGRFFFLFV